MKAKQSVLRVCTEGIWSDWSELSGCSGCRYLLRVTVVGKGMTPDSRRDFPIWVRNYEKLHEATAPIKVPEIWAGRREGR